jgi:hypothetical protein
MIEFHMALKFFGSQRMWKSPFDAATADKQEEGISFPSHPRNSFPDRA